jgi:hypothetical protein
VSQNTGVRCRERKCKVPLCYTASEHKLGVAARSMVRARLGEGMHKNVLCNRVDSESFGFMQEASPLLRSAGISYGWENVQDLQLSIHPIFAVKSCSSELSVGFKSRSEKLCSALYSR